MSSIDSMTAGKALGLGVMVEQRQISTKAVEQVRQALTVEK
jgi:hypothetical protein